MLWLDLETWSDTPISCGTARYAETADILLLAWAEDDGPVSVWDVEVEPMPRRLAHLLLDGGTVITAHNAQFDAQILTNARNANDLMRQAGRDIWRWRCTMAQALSHSLPPSLGVLCTVLGVPQELRKQVAEGGKLVRLFTTPRPRTSRLPRADRFTHPEDWKLFVEYAVHDVLAMRECATRMPSWNWQAEDLACWQLDQEINRRGVPIDMHFVQEAVDLCAVGTEEVNARLSQATKGAVTSVNQTEKMRLYLSFMHGVEVDDLRADTLERLVEDESLAPEVRALLGLRLAGAKASVRKYQKLVLVTSTADDRARFQFQFRGASRSGRDAGRDFQPQNLARPQAKPKDIKAWIEHVSAGDWRLLGEADLSLASDGVRGSVAAKPGKKLLICDYRNVEGRGSAWLVGEQWKLDAFRAFDAGVGEDLYHLSYARAFGGDPAAVTKDQRQRGKVLDLAGGYQGWVGACMTFAVAYRIRPMPGDEEARAWMSAWRDAHPAYVASWYALEQAALSAVAYKGKTQSVEGMGQDIRMVVRDGWLLVRLPSGRLLTYPGIGVRDGRLSYLGVDQLTRKWGVIDTYGGKLLENLTQALAADLLWVAIANLEAAGYAVVMRVHDELVCEVPDTPEYTLQEMKRLMLTQREWAATLPLAAAGSEAYRYGK